MLLKANTAKEVKAITDDLYMEIKDVINEGMTFEEAKDAIINKLTEFGLKNGFDYDVCEDDLEHEIEIVFWYDDDFHEEIFVYNPETELYSNDSETYTSIYVKY